MRGERLQRLSFWTPEFLILDEPAQTWTVNCCAEYRNPWTEYGIFYFGNPAIFGRVNIPTNRIYLLTKENHWRNHEWMNVVKLNMVGKSRPLTKRCCYNQRPRNFIRKISSYWMGQFCLPNDYSMIGKVAAVCRMHILVTGFGNRHNWRF